MSIVNIDSSYTDLKDVSLANSSMLNMFNILKDEDDNYFMNIFKTFDISSDILSTPGNTENINVVEPWWEDLAYSYYNDTDLWWAICLSNYVLNPFEEINEGDILSVLSKEFVPHIQRDMGDIYKL